MTKADSNNNYKNSILALGLALLSIIIPILLFYADRDTKELSYDTIYISEIINLDNDKIENAKFIIKGNEYKTVYSTEILFKNTGNIPIQKNDFANEMSISFGKNAKILTSKIINKTPENLKPIIKFEEKEILIEPLLLNPGDSFVIQSLIDNNFKTPTVYSRISGIKNPTKIKNYKREYIPYLSLMGSFLCVSFYFYFGGVFLARRKKLKENIRISTTEWMLITLALYLAGGIAFGFGINRLENLPIQHDTAAYILAFAGTPMFLLGMWKHRKKRYE